MVVLEKEKLWTKDFIGISLASLFLFIPFYTLMITLPIYTLEDLGGNETQVGLIVTVFLISAVLIRPFTGILLDRFGKKEMLYFSLFIFFIASALYIFTTSFKVLLLLRFFHGFGFGIATIATGTIVADIVPEQRRGEGMGYFALFMNLAMVIGPFLGLIFLQYVEFNKLFVMIALLSLISLLLSFIPKLAWKKSYSESEVANFEFKIDNLFERKVIPIVFIAGILAFFYSSVLSFISIYAQQIDLVKTASVFFLVYAFFLILTRPISGRAFDRLGESYVIYPSILLFGLGMIILSQTTHSFSFLLAGALIGIGYGTVGPSIQTVAINNVEPQRRATATATFFTFFDGGMGLGSFTLGIVASHIGLSKLYLISGVCVLGVLVLYYYLHGKNRSLS